MANAYSHDAMCALNSAVACANCAWRRSRIPDTSSIESAASDLFVRVADNRGVEWPAPAASCSAARRRCLRRGRAKHGRIGWRWEFIEHLVEGLGRLPRPVLLVIDDLHQLRSDEALRALRSS